MYCRSGKHCLATVLRLYDIGEISCSYKHETHKKKSLLHTYYLLCHLYFHFLWSILKETLLHKHKEKKLMTYWSLVSGFKHSCVYFFSYQDTLHIIYSFQIISELFNEQTVRYYSLLHSPILSTKPRCYTLWTWVANHFSPNTTKVLSRGYVDRQEC